MDREQISSVLAGALGDHNDEDDGCDLCGPSFTCDVKLVLDEVPGLLAAIDELEADRDYWRRVAASRHVIVCEVNEQVNVKQAALEKVLRLHQMKTWRSGDFCGRCGTRWPCETVRAATDG